MSTTTTTTTLQPSFLPLLLSLEYLLGGLPRLTPHPFARAHARLRTKTLRTAPHLAPFFPFTDVAANTNTTTSSRPDGGDGGGVGRKNTKNLRRHMAFVGALMVLEALLLALPATRAAAPTLVLGVVLPAAGAWSQRRAGMVWGLPVVNLVLGLVVHFVEAGGGGA